MTLNELAIETGDFIYYEQGYRIMIESHLAYLLKHEGTKVIAVESFLAYKYEGDLTGMLDEMKVPRQYHYPIMLMNRFSSPTDMPSSTQALIIPSFNEIDMLCNIYRSKKE